MIPPFNTLEPLAGHPELREAFWSRVDTTGDGCWLWKLSIGQFGYGQWTVDVVGGRDNRRKRTLRTHRIAYELTYGPIPKGLDVCHKCDVRRCCRPDHLFVGTRLDNMRDAKAKGRIHKGITPVEDRHLAPARPIDPRLVRGERNNMARMTAETVRDARRRWLSGEASGAELAREYGLTNSGMLRVLKRLAWRHIE